MYYDYSEAAFVVVCKLLACPLIALPLISGTASDSGAGI